MALSPVTRALAEAGAPARRMAWEAHLAAPPRPSWADAPVYYHPHEEDAGPVHGRMSTYTNHRCRCDECREARRTYRPERLGLGEPGVWPSVPRTSGYSVSAHWDWSAQ